MNGSAAVDRQALVDQLIDRSLAESAATDWSLTLPEDWLAALPVDGDTLTRPVDTQHAGYFRTPVYRYFEVVPQPLTKPVLMLSDVSSPTTAVWTVEMLIMNTEAGVIGRTLGEIGLGHGGN